MNVRLRQCSLILAAGLFACAPFALANPGHGDDGGGPPASHPGGGGGGGNGGGGNGGGGNGGGGGGNSGDHPSGPPATPPGHSGGTKIHGPSGTCSADTTLNGIDVQGPDGQSGASHVAHTDFTLVDTTTGEPVASSESATMMYFWYGSTFDYVLNAHGLTPGSQWTLTYQAEPLPSPGAICLGSATVNGGGQLHLASSVELNSNLPPALDPTADPATQPPDALLALVPTADVDCTAGTLTNFEPDVYLWTNPRVRYVDTDLLAPPAP